MSLNIERLNVDFYNDRDVDVLAATTFNSPTPLLYNASQYTATVEFSSIDLSNLVIDATPDYEFMILNDEGDKVVNRFPDLPHYINYFKFEGQLKDVMELDQWFYNIFHKKALPLSLGTLALESNGFFRRIVSQAEYDESFGNGLFKVYVNKNLRRLLPELVSELDTEMMNGKTWWALQDAVGDRKQSKDTLAQLLKATSIRFYSSLPTNDYLVYNQALGVIIPETILSTVAINNQTTDILNKSSLRYQPNVYRHFSLVNSEPIQSFRIWAKIYYANGSSLMHTLQPGDYMNLQIAFHPKPQQLTEEEE